MIDTNFDGFSDDALRDAIEQARELAAETAECAQRGYSGLDRKSGGQTVTERAERVATWARAATFELLERQALRALIETWAARRV